MTYRRYWVAVIQPIGSTRKRRLVKARMTGTSKKTEVRDAGMKCGDLISTEAFEVSSHDLHCYCEAKERARRQKAESKFRLIEMAVQSLVRRRVDIVVVTAIVSA